MDRKYSGVNIQLGKKYPEKQPVVSEVIAKYDSIVH